MTNPLLAIILWALVVTTPLVSRNNSKLSEGRVVKAPPQQSAAPQRNQPSPDTDRIVNAFTAKETEFRNALAQYRFKRDATVQTIGAGKQISGDYRRTSQLTVDGSGKLIEKLLFFPTPTLRTIGVSTEDLDELFGVQFFALETSKAPLYNFKYVGQERIDELDLHVFEVSPKTLPDPKKIQGRLFQGRVWVDVEGHQIVKLRGKGLPEPKNSLSPTIETYREEIDGHWFPTYAYADEDLPDAGGGLAVKLRLRIRFSEFEKVERK
jgi:hypothetical protein